MSEVAILPGYYTLPEAADIIGVSRVQVSRYVAKGLLKAVDLGNQFVIEQAAVHNFKRRPRGNPGFGKRDES